MIVNRCRDRHPAVGRLPGPGQGLAGLGHARRGEHRRRPGPDHGRALVRGVPQLRAPRPVDDQEKRGPAGALALLVLAMAQHRLQQADRSRYSLAKATALIPHQLATLGSPDFKGPLPVGADVVGHDWLIAEILRREAALLILKDARRPPD